MTAAETADAVEATAPQPAASTARWGRIALKVGRLVFTLAVLTAMVYTTVTQWQDVKNYVLSIPWQSAVLSLGMVLAGIGAGALAWRAALADVGHRVPVRTAGQIYIIGLLAKYLPGSIWVFVLQMELGKRADLPRSRSFLASVVQAGIGTTIALVLGLFGLPALLAVDSPIRFVLLVLVPISLVCAHPRVLTWLVQRLLAILRRPPLEQAITWRAIGAVAGWSAVGWLAFGVHLWLLANSEATPGVSGLFRCIGAIALGLTAGMFAFLSPSGLGVREAIIVAALLPYVPPGVAFGMALASRMLFILGDLVAAGIAGLSWVRDGRRTAAVTAGLTGS